MYLERMPAVGQLPDGCLGVGLRADRAVGRHSESAVESGQYPLDLKPEDRPLRLRDASRDYQREQGQHQHNNPSEPT